MSMLYENHESCNILIKTIALEDVTFTELVYTSLN